MFADRRRTEGNQLAAVYGFRSPAQLDGIMKDHSFVLCLPHHIITAAYTGKQAIA